MSAPAANPLSGAGPLWAVVVFPGSNCDQDCVHALRDVLGARVVEVWHKDSVPADAECIVIPGGFSYGDYLRAGALASMSPVMDSVRAAAARGALVLGICNGFQVLVESGLLPGVLMRNAGLRFRCRDAHLRVERADTPFTAGAFEPGEVIRLPIAHGFGNYYLPPGSEALAERQGVLAYCDEDGGKSPGANPNGSFADIAGIANEAGNVLGMMPHPERACETLLGGTDGLRLLRAMHRNAGAKAAL